MLILSLSIIQANYGSQRNCSLLVPLSLHTIVPRTHSTLLKTVIWYNLMNLLSHGLLQKRHLFGSSFCKLQTKNYSKNIVLVSVRSTGCVPRGLHLSPDGASIFVILLDNQIFKKPLNFQSRDC